MKQELQKVVKKKFLEKIKLPLEQYEKTTDKLIKEDNKNLAIGLKKIEMQKIQEFDNEAKKLLQKLNSMPIENQVEGVNTSNFTDTSYISDYSATSITVSDFSWE